MCHYTIKFFECDHKTDDNVKGCYLWEKTGTHCDIDNPSVRKRKECSIRSQNVTGLCPRCQSRERSRLLREREERARVEREQEAERARVEKEQEAERARVKKEQDEERARMQREQERERARIKREQEAERVRLQRAWEEERAQLEREREEERARVERELQRERERVRIKKEQEAERARMEREQEIERVRIQREQEAELARLKKEWEEERARLEREREQERARVERELQRERERLEREFEQEMLLRDLEKARIADQEEQRRNAEAHEAHLRRVQAEADAAWRAEQEAKNSPPHSNVSPVKEPTPPPSPPPPPSPVPILPPPDFSQPPKDQSYGHHFIGGRRQPVHHTQKLASSHPLSPTATSQPTPQTPQTPVRRSRPSPPSSPPSTGRFSASRQTSWTATKKPLASGGEGDMASELQAMWNRRGIRRESEDEENAVTGAEVTPEESVSQIGGAGKR